MVDRRKKNEMQVDDTLQCKLTRMIPENQHYKAQNNESEQKLGNSETPKLRL